MFTLRLFFSNGNGDRIIYVQKLPFQVRYLQLEREDRKALVHSLLAVEWWWWFFL